MVCAHEHVHACDHHFIVIAFMVLYCIIVHGHFLIMWGWLALWFFFQVNKLTSLLSPFSGCFLCCCAWPFSSHLLALLCIVLLFPPPNPPAPHFQGVWVCKAFTMPLGWLFSWSFFQVSKFISLLSPSFSHFFHCCVWSSSSHLLALLCVVVFSPPFMGVGCVGMEL